LALERVDLSHTRVTDALAPTVRAWTKLRELALTATSIGDQVFTAACQHAGITLLEVANTKVSTTALQHLKSLKGLRTLDLSHLPFTDSQLSLLKDCSALSLLMLHGTKVTATGLASAAHLQVVAEIVLSERSPRLTLSDAGKV
jgi:hypothetical protein